MKEINFFDEKPSDFLDILRLGANTIQKKYGVYLSNEIHDYSVIKDRVVQYDIDISGDFTDILSYTEFLQTVGGVHLGLANKKYEIKRNEEHIKDHENSHLNDFAEQNILKCMDSKYISYPHFSKKQFDCIVFLPGSNIMKEVTDLHKIHTMILQHNAFIKPHPLTSIADLQFLNREFRHRVINKKTDALDLINHTKKVAICGSSELFVYSILKNKAVYSVSNEGNNSSKKGGYYFIFDNVINLPVLKRKRALLNIITHKESGIFLPFLNKNISLWEYINKI